MVIITQLSLKLIDTSLSGLLFLRKTNVVPPDDQPQSFHWPQHEHRGSIGGTSGLEAAQKIDPLYEAGQESMHYSGLTNIHQHRGSIGGVSGLHPAEKLDPPGLADVPAFSQPNPFSQQSVAAHQNMTALGALDMEPNSFEDEEAGRRSVTRVSPQYNDRFERQSHFPSISDLSTHFDPESTPRRKSFSFFDPNPPSQSSEHPRKSSEPNPSSSSAIFKRSDSRRSDSREEPRSTANPHRNDFLNLLDPRVDLAAVRKEREKVKERELLGLMERQGGV